MAICNVNEKCQVCAFPDQVLTEEDLPKFNEIIEKMKDIHFGSDIISVKLDRMRVLIRSIVPLNVAIKAHVINSPIFEKFISTNEEAIWSDFKETKQ